MTDAGQHERIHIVAPGLCQAERESASTGQRPGRRRPAPVPPDKQQVWLERSFHVATLDHDADLIAERTLAFITQHGTAPKVGEGDTGRSADA